MLKWHPFYDIIPVRSKRNHDLVQSSFCLEKYMEIKFAYGKCVFTRPRIENVDQMVQMMNNENIASMLSAKRRIITRESELEWIQAHQDDLTFSAYDRESLEFIGNCSFNEIDGKRGEIGLSICAHMQGKHYAKDIISGLAAYGFRELELDEIYAIVFSDNVRSLQCVTELGFKEYARKKNVLERNGVPVDDVYLRIKRN